MSYQIVQFSEADIPRITNFQVSAVHRHAINKKNVGLSNHVLSPANKSSLKYAAQIKMLYASVIPDTTEILGFAVGYSPLASIENPRLKMIFEYSQKTLGQAYILLVHSFLKEGIDQKNMLSLLLKEIFERAEFFEYSKIVFPCVYRNTTVQNYLPSFEFELRDTFQMDDSKIPPINLFCRTVPQKKIR